MISRGKDNRWREEKEIEKQGGEKTWTQQIEERDAKQKLLKVRCLPHRSRNKRDGVEVCRLLEGFD